MVRIAGKGKPVTSFGEEISAETDLFVGWFEGRFDSVDAGCLADDFPGAADFFFFVVGAAARAFFFGSAAFDLPLANGAGVSAAGLFSTDTFGFLGTVVLSIKVFRPNTSSGSGASGFCNATVA
ncbi:MAG TPA: hypothetical protein VE086_02560 [Chthoniobacterales bacterium]|nr:hypothetical protein [Chthoniobacterales bacterium]